MLKDKILGCIYGLAIGDALGYPNEFNNRQTNLERTGGRGIIDFEPILNWSKRIIKKINGKYVIIPKIDFPEGTYSDDTQMSLAIAKGIIKSDLNNYNINEIMNNITQEFIEWYDSPENNRAPGRSCIYACDKLKKGIHWKQSGKYDAKGCGTAMRSAPIGLFFSRDLDKLIEVASTASNCTHLHPTAESAGIATAYLTSLAINDVCHQDWISKVLNAPFLNEELKKKVAQILEVQSEKNVFNALNKLGHGWTGHEAVAMALYCVLNSPKNYEKTVLTAANAEGDTDSIACIAGAISGAYNGIKKIPIRWIKNIEKTECLQQIAEKIYCKINA